MEGESKDRFTPHWRLWVAIFWVAASVLMIWERRNGIRWFALGDTDDNMRMMQVRALIEGQGWFDLAQHRLSGSNIHWSRLVDLPIAAIKLVLTPFTGGLIAEKAAVTLAPLLPMAVAMTAVAVTCRRLLSPKAFALGVGLLVCAHSARSMWSPLRIDHHGWQLAMLALAMMALVDPKRARGGALLGVATALSLVIGLEMLLYFTVAGGLIVLMWIRDGGQARRLATYGATLSGGSALGYLLFASYANRFPVCDALSPVWLSAMVAAGAVAVLLSLVRQGDWKVRLVLAAVAGALLAGAFVLAWPDCVGRLEQSSPELERLWLSKVREALPIYRHPTSMVAVMVSLPIIGLIGYCVMLWRSRRDPDILIPWAGAGALALLSAALLLWQTRAVPAAQLLSLPGVAALGWLLIPWFQSKTNAVLRIVGTVAVFVLISGLGTLYATWLVPQEKTKGRKAVEVANNRCPTLPALAPIARLERGLVLSFVDLGPRLITVTPHDAVTGPYHRNARQIIDVMRTWRGDAANARRTVERYGADYVLICPGMSESTIYRSEAPGGFYVQLARGQVPDWLERVALPANSPYKMWRVIRSGSPESRR